MGEVVVEEKISGLFEAAFRMHQAGDLEDANRVYTEILDLNPKHFDALHLSGLIAAQAEAPNLAIELISNALKVKAGDAIANNNLGIVYHEVQNYEKALDCYRNALVADPSYSDAFYNLGNTFFAMQHFDKAIACYEDVITINSIAMKMAL